MMNVMVVGYGYLGQAIAREFRDLGSEVFGVSRVGGDGLVEGDVSDRESVMAWPDADWVVHCASSSRGGEEAYQRVYVDGCQNLLARYSGRSLVFVSSTSVYGQVDGAWVTEESATEPSRQTGRLLLAAEGLVLAAGGRVARLAGIYGPGRSVLLRKYFSGEARIEDGGLRALNQIHRDDAARALVKVIVSGRAGEVYNVCDDQPMSQLECYQQLVAEFGGELPASAPKDVNRKRGWTDKRVSNQKLRKLGWMPQYPNFLVGAREIGENF